MAQVRALTTIFHNGFLIKAGELFEYADELAAKLKGKVEEGIEIVTDKSTAAFAKAQAKAQKALDDTAASLHKAYETLKADLEADPTRGDLVQKVLDAEAAATDAAKAATASSDLV
jgi:hypothetical protein